jgi:MFS family permease
MDPMPTIALNRVKRLMSDAAFVRTAWINAPVWAMLTALCAVAAMSQAFRTVATVLAGELQSEFGASAQELGLFAAAFHLSFAATQIVMGVALDVFGPRRTVSAAFLVALLGVLVSAFAPSLPVLTLGQLLIGIGCAPAFVGTMLFVANRYPSDQFTRLSGLVLSFSGIGMLVTGTPLAWVVEMWSWRGGFFALAVCATLVLLAVLLVVSDGPGELRRDRESLRQAFHGTAAALFSRHTLGMVVLGAVTYASFITLRGLWAVPMLIDRHGYTLLESGHVMLAVSVATLLGPSIFGLVDMNGRARRAWIIGCTILYAALFGVLALSSAGAVDVALAILLGLLTGYFVLQYADVRAAYPEQMAGRAFGVFNTAVFLGVALMQGATGLVASLASNHGGDPFVAVFATISVLLLAAAVAFLLLPWPTGLSKVQNDQHRTRREATASPSCGSHIALDAPTPLRASRHGKPAFAGGTRSS